MLDFTFLFFDLFPRLFPHLVLHKLPREKFSIEAAS